MRVEKVEPNQIHSYCGSVMWVKSGPISKSGEFFTTLTTFCDFWWWEWVFFFLFFQIVLGRITEHAIETPINKVFGGSTMTGPTNGSVVQNIKDTIPTWQCTNLIQSSICVAGN